MARKIPKQAPDKERILTVIIEGLSVSRTLARKDADEFKEGSWVDPWGGMYVHFARYRKPVPGDLVIGQTGFANDWKIAFYVQDKGNSDHVIKHIETGQLCNYGNESFIPIAGLKYTDLLVGVQRQVFIKILKACRDLKMPQYMYYRDMKFDGAEALVTIRKRSWSDEPVFERTVRIPWTKSMPIKTYTAAIEKELNAVP